MRNQILKVFALVAAVLFGSTPAEAAECPPCDWLWEAANTARVSINREQTVTASAPGVSFAGTSVAGFEQVPATQLPRGADAGFIYLDAPTSGIPAGYYRLNARAANPQLGTYEGTVSLISMEGKEVARVPATMETWSMEVPRPLPYAQTAMDVHVSHDPSTGGEPSRIIIIIYCPNGTIIIIRLPY
jgi:hypothetical protein